MRKVNKRTEVSYCSHKASPESTVLEWTKMTPVFTLTYRLSETPEDGDSNGLSLLRLDFPTMTFALMALSCTSSLPILIMPAIIMRAGPMDRSTCRGTEVASGQKPA